MVRGQVQGVGYRYFVVEQARQLGVGGWVRNLPEGTVEAEAVGERVRLERFLEGLRRGPGRVDAVEAAWAQGVGEREATGFRILG